MENNKKDIRCTQCAAEFMHAELEGAQACPACGSTGVPCDIREDVAVSINWHELRILGIWATNYAATLSEPSQRVLRAILKRLQAQHPTMMPLSWEEEVRVLQTEMPSIGLYDAQGNPIVPPVKVQ